MAGKKRRVSLKDIEKRRAPALSKKKKASKKKASKKKAAKKKAAKKNRTVAKLIAEAKDEQLRSFVRAWIAHGFKIAPAFREVFHETTSASEKGKELLALDKVQAMVREELSVKGEREEITKEWMLGKLREQIEANLLDFFGDDGFMLPVDELKKLPVELQRQIKKLNTQIHEGPAFRTVKGKDGKPKLVAVKDEDGNVIMERKQFAHVTIHDKQKAMEIAGKISGFIGGDETHIHFNTAELIREREAQVERLSSPEVIDGESERVS